MKIKEITSGLAKNPKQLDVSIQNFDKFIIGSGGNFRDKIFSEMLDDEFQITQKTDGVKLTLWRNTEPFDAGDYRKNWVVAYKNRIMFESEFRNLGFREVLADSIGFSQYAIAHEHLRAVHHKCKNIEPGTEFFVEFVMRKPTTTRDYEKYHAMILIGYSPADAEISGGMIYTSPKGFFQEENQTLAEKLELNLPKKIFEGKLRDLCQLNEGRVNLPTLDLNQTPKKSYQSLKDFLLSFDSEFGGKEEGVVLQSPSKILKIIQPDQHSKELRYQKKKRWMGSPEEELQYWDEIHAFVDKNLPALGELENRLCDFSAKVYRLRSENLPEHPKKLGINCKDDIYLTGREKILRQDPLNQNALFIGKMRVPTKMHIKIIQEAMKTHNSVVVGLVSGKNQIVPFELRKESILRACPGVEILDLSTGNAVTAMGKTRKMISSVYCGTDRYEGYRQQLARTSGVKLIEIKRDQSNPGDVSATKAVRALEQNDREAFENLTPKEIHDFFEEFKKYFP